MARKRIEIRPALGPTRFRTTVAIGAVISLGVGIGPAPAQDRALGTVTYAEDVAPILNTNCVVCHRPGAIGPFTLATFADVKPRARLIADVVQSGAMPPWKPAPGVERLSGERRLTARGRSDPELGRRRCARRRPAGPTGLASVARWVACRHTRSGRHDGDPLHPPSRERRCLS